MGVKRWWQLTVAVFLLASTVGATTFGTFTTTTFTTTTLTGATSTTSTLAGSLAPVANAGPDQFTQTLSTLTFNGSRSEEHTSELQSQSNLVCRLLLEKKKNTHRNTKCLLAAPPSGSLPILYTARPTAGRPLYGRPRLAASPARSYHQLRARATADHRT